MNHITLIGRLCADPELRYTPNGTAVATFNLAVPRPKYNDQEQEPDFIKIVTWQKTAENCANYLKKGRLAAIEGRLQIRKYETQDGQKRTAAEVVANYVQFLEKANSQETPPPQSNQSNQPDEGLGGINLDDLPL